MLVSDDPSEASGWSDATGRGVLRWEWGECCSDGMVFGPLPTDSFCLNVRYSIPVEGLTSLRLRRPCWLRERERRSLRLCERARLRPRPRPS